MADNPVPVVFNVVGIQELERANKVLAPMAKQSGPVARATKNTARFGHTAQNVSYQVQDLIVQIQGGVNPARALSQQLPQMTVGFGLWGAAIGVVAAALPALIAGLSGTSDEIDDLNEHLETLLSRSQELANTTSTVSFDTWIQNFNQMDAAARQLALSILQVEQRLLSTELRAAADEFAKIGQLGTLGSLGNAQMQAAASSLQISVGAVEQIVSLVRSVDGDLLGNPETIRQVAELLGDGGERAKNLLIQLQGLKQVQSDLQAASNIEGQAGAAIGTGGLLPEGGEGGWTEEMRAFGAELREVNEIRKEIGKGPTLVEQMGLAEQGLQLFESTFTNVVTGIAMGTQSIDDAVKSMVQSILAQLAQMAAQWLATQALMMAFGGPAGGGGFLSGLLGNAKGNAFANGRVMAFAKGGIVSQPTVFPMARGAGLMGEAGPEAIMPLQRNSRGELGVSSGGAANVTFNIQAMDARGVQDVLRQQRGFITGMVNESMNDRGRRL